VSQLTTEAGRKFQVVGAAQLNDCLSMAVRLKGTSSSGTLMTAERSQCSDLVCRQTKTGWTL